jgi:L-fucose mutarotase/ribose pyranase (RbsD/FucU family)
MSSKQEIKNLFIAEIKNTPEYQIVLQIKALILNEIAAPHIQKDVVYNFETPLSKEQENNVKLCMIVEFGFYTDNMSGYSIIIDMTKFLE